MTIQLIQGDCLDAMRAMPSNSVDTCITDPPYALEFMGKGWDKVLPSVEIWKQVLRVLKPGAMLMAFGGTRTYHRLTVAIEDAGFEIRDCMMWLYGQGFPKSLDIGKAIDRAAGIERKVVGYDASRRRPNRTGKVMGEKEYDRTDNGATLTAPATDAAKLWDGYGTALKPAYEPVVLAMKPLDGTFAANAQKWGVAGLNIDAGRIATADKMSFSKAAPFTDKVGTQGRTWNPTSTKGMDRSQNDGGRWPANVLLDECAAKQLGEPARFFYTAKSSKSERGEENTHATVKPLALMEYLCKLTATPTDGIVLDPFMGSGTTGVACVNLNRSFIGVELNADYYTIACNRIKAANESQ